MAVRWACCPPRPGPVFCFIHHICTAHGLELFTAVQPASEVIDNTSKHGCNYVAIQLALVTPLLKHYFPTHVVKQIKLTEWEIGLTETERAHPDQLVKMPALLDRRAFVLRCLYCSPMARNRYSLKHYGIWSEFLHCSKERHCTGMSILFTDMT